MLSRVVCILVLGLALGDASLAAENAPPIEPALAPAPPSRPAFLDRTATLQIVIGPALDQHARMEWGVGVYANDSIDLEALLVRLYSLRTPAQIRWECPPPSENLRFVAKMPDQREDLFEQIAVPALGACLGLSISRENVEAEVYVLTTPNGPGPELEQVPTASGGHNGYQTPTELFATGSDFEWLVKELETRLGRLVIDETGYSGPWNWDLRFEPNNVESLRQAAGEQLGLVLTPERREIEMVVIRKADPNREPDPPK